MKRFLSIVAFSFLSSSFLSAQGAPRVDIGISVMELALIVGVEVPMSDDFAIRAEIGPSLFSLEGDLALKTGLTGIYYFAHNEKGDLGVHFGLPDAFLVFADSFAFRLSPGIGMTGVLSVSDPWYFRAALGVGYAYYYEDKEGSWGDDDLFGITPELKICAGYKLDE